MPALSRPHPRRRPSHRPIPLPATVHAAFVDPFLWTLDAAIGTVSVHKNRSCAAPAARHGEPPAIHRKSLQRRPAYHDAEQIQATSCRQGATANRLDPAAPLHRRSGAERCRREDAGTEGQGAARRGAMSSRRCGHRGAGRSATRSDVVAEDGGIASWQRSGRVAQGPARGSGAGAAREALVACVVRAGFRAQRWRRAVVTNPDGHPRPPPGGEEAQILCAAVRTLRRASQLPSWPRRFG